MSLEQTGALLGRARLPSRFDRAVLLERFPPVPARNQNVFSRSVENHADGVAGAAFNGNGVRVTV
jgi:hypothetical protein